MFGNLYANTVTAFAIWYPYHWLICRKLVAVAKRGYTSHYVVKDRTGPGELIFVILPLQVPRHFQIQEEEEQAPFVGVKLDTESCWLALCV